MVVFFLGIEDGGLPFLIQPVYVRVACSATISTFLTQSHPKIWVKDINLPQMNPKCMYQLLFLTDDWSFCVCVCVCCPWLLWTIC